MCAFMWRGFHCGHFLSLSVSSPHIKKTDIPFAREFRLVVTALALSFLLMCSKCVERTCVLSSSSTVQALGMPHSFLLAGRVNARGIHKIAYFLVLELPPPVSLLVSNPSV